MSPTSYQTAPPRTLILSNACRVVKPALLAVRKLQDRCALLLFVDHVAADDRHEVLRVENFGLGNLHDVLRQDGEIGEFAGRDRAFYLLFKRGVCWPEGESLQRLLAGHRFLRV